jgi:thiosulfate/3-mercaptopyruvate sulfurtransferase
MTPLVSTEWLAGELGKADLVVFDATKYLPNENLDGRALFAEARIPGARFFDIDEAADPEASLPHMVPTPARFEKLMAALGVSNTSRIVFYDQKGMYSSARGWWLMRLFGHEGAAVLDGGLPKWRREGRAVESGPAAPAPPATFHADFQATRLRGLGDVKRIVRQGGGSELILDARAAGRYAGTAPEPRPGLPSGHMPGAASLPFTELFAPDGTMLAPAELRRRFEAAGADDTRPVVTSCGTGVTACVLALGAVLAGLPEPAVYDGSWTEWASRPETPKATL